MNHDAIKNLFNLNGKAALVTGGGQGIGKAVAVLLANAGADVAVADLNLKGALNVVEEIEASGTKTVAIEADVSKSSHVEDMVTRTVEALGGVDILVNNAGIFPPKISAFELEDEDWDRVYNLNTKGVFMCTKFAAKQMVEQKNGGKIINMASIEGFKTLASGMAHYEASKASVVMLTKSMAIFLAPHKINVNAVAPGVIDSEGLRKVFDAIGKEAGDIYGPKIPLRRLGTPEDIANGVLFLASKASDYITGETILIDGGFVIA